MDRLEELKRALEIAYQEGRQDDVLILAREIDRLEKGIEAPVAPGELPAAPVEEEAARPATGSGYSVGDALVGLRNMGVPNEAIAAI